MAFRLNYAPSILRYEHTFSDTVHTLRRSLSRICAALVTDRIQCYLRCLIHSSTEDTGRLMTQIEHFNMVVQECKHRAYPIRKSKWRVLRAHSSVRAGNGTRDCRRHLFYVLNPSIKLCPSFIPRPPPPPPPPLPPLPLR